MSFNFSPKIVTDGLVFYVDAVNSKSYTSGSTNWFDLTRNSNNFTATATSLYNSSNLGSIVFDGTASRRFLSGLVNTYNANNGVTISCWMNFTGGSTSCVFFSHDSNANNGIRFTISNGNLAFTLGSVADYITTFPITVGWKNVVASVSGNTANFYVNATLVSVLTIGTMAGSPNLFRIGQFHLSDTAHFRGFISNVMFYNIPLTQNQILQNYNTMKARFGL